jgi:small subunit ribosomal protein S3
MTQTGEKYTVARRGVIAEDAAIRDAVRRSAGPEAGVRAIDVDRAPDRLRVIIRAARPIVLAGPRGAEADRLRGEIAELTGGRVRLDILEAG